MGAKKNQQQKSAARSAPTRSILSKIKTRLGIKSKVSKNSQKKTIKIKLDSAKVKQENTLNLKQKTKSSPSTLSTSLLSTSSTSLVNQQQQEIASSSSCQSINKSINTLTKCKSRKITNTVVKTKLQLEKKHTVDKSVTLSSDDLSKIDGMKSVTGDKITISELNLSCAQEKPIVIKENKTKAINKMLKKLDIKISGFKNVLPDEQNVVEECKTSICEMVKTKCRAAAVKTGTTNNAQSSQKSSSSSSLKKDNFDQICSNSNSSTSENIIEVVKKTDELQTKEDKVTKVKTTRTNQQNKTMNVTVTSSIPDEAQQTFDVKDLEDKESESQFSNKQNTVATNKSNKAQNKLTAKAKLPKTNSKISNKPRKATTNNDQTNTNSDNKKEKQLNPKTKDDKKGTEKEKDNSEQENKLEKTKDVIEGKVKEIRFATDDTKEKEEAVKSVGTEGKKKKTPVKKPIKENTGKPRKYTKRSKIDKCESKVNSQNSDECKKSNQNTAKKVRKNAKNLKQKLSETDQEIKTKSEDSEKQGTAKAEDNEIKEKIPSEKEKSKINVSKNDLQTKESPEEKDTENKVAEINNETDKKSDGNEGKESTKSLTLESDVTTKTILPSKKVSLAKQPKVAKCPLTKPVKRGTKKNTLSLREKLQKKYVNPGSFQSFKASKQKAAAANKETIKSIDLTVTSKLNENQESKLDKKDVVEIKKPEKDIYDFKTESEDEDNIKMNLLNESVKKLLEKDFSDEDDKPLHLTKLEMEDEDDKPLSLCKEEQKKEPVSVATTSKPETPQKRATSPIKSEKKVTDKNEIKSPLKTKDDKKPNKSPKKQTIKRTKQEKPESDDDDDDDDGGHKIRKNVNSSSTSESSTDSEDNNHHLRKKASFGPKRMASLNALAKVQCLYENESRTAHELGLSKTATIPKIKTINSCSSSEEDGKDGGVTSVKKECQGGKYAQVKKETTSEIEPKRELRNAPGLRGVGKHWDFDDDFESGHESDVAFRKDYDIKSKTKKRKIIKGKVTKQATAKEKQDGKMKKVSAKPQKKKVKVVPVKKSSAESSSGDDEKNDESDRERKSPEMNKRKRDKNEDIGELRGILARKRMASLNASALVAATYDIERHLDRNLGSDCSSFESFPEDEKPQILTASKGNKKETTTTATLKTENLIEETSSKESSKDTTSSRPTSSSVVIVQDTDVTITGVYVNSSVGAGQEAYCKMQYRVQSSVTEERVLCPTSIDPPKSYTPLGALSSMRPPGATIPTEAGQQQSSIHQPQPQSLSSQQQQPPSTNIYQSPPLSGEEQSHQSATSHIYPSHHYHQTSAGIPTSHHQHHQEHQQYVPQPPPAHHHYSQPAPLPQLHKYSHLPHHHHPLDASSHQSTNSQGRCDSPSTLRYQSTGAYQSPHPPPPPTISMSGSGSSAFCAPMQQSHHDLTGNCNSRNKNHSKFDNKNHGYFLKMAQLENETKLNVNAIGIQQLPIEILVKILEYLNYEDQKIASLICRQWYKILHWQKFLPSTSLVKIEDLNENYKLLCSTFRNLFIKLPIDMNILENVISIGNVQTLTICTKKLLVDVNSIIDIIKKFTNLNELQMIVTVSEFKFHQPTQKTKFCSLDASFPNITSLSISIDYTGNYQDYPEIFIFEILDLFPNIEILKLSFSRYVLITSDKACTFLNKVTLKELYLENAIWKVTFDKTNSDKIIDLRKLSLNPCMLQFQEIDHMTSFLQSQKNLKSLHLSNANRFNDIILNTMISNLNELEELDLSRSFADTTIKDLKRLKNLKSLNVSWCQCVTSDHLCNGIASCKNFQLKVLHVTKTKICRNGLIQCVKNFPNLQVLDVSRCSRAATDTSLQVIIRNLKDLRHLSLRRCELISDKGITGISFKIDPNVIFTNDNDDNISDDGNGKNKGVPISNLKKLQSLSLNCCPITDISLIHGLEFQELRDLSLLRCTKLSLSGIEMLAKKCPSIVVLKMDDKLKEESVLKNFKRLNLNAKSKAPFKF